MLLYLIKKQNIDVLNISIASILALCAICRVISAHRSCSRVFGDGGDAGGDQVDYYYPERNWTIEASNPRAELIRRLRDMSVLKQLLKIWMP